MKDDIVLHILVLIWFSSLQSNSVFHSFLKTQSLCAKYQGLKSRLWLAIPAVLVQPQYPGHTVHMKHKCILACLILSLRSLTKLWLEGIFFSYVRDRKWEREKEIKGTCLCLGCFTLPFLCKVHSHICSSWRQAYTYSCINQNVTH